MGTMLGLLGLMLGAWAARSICMKPINNVVKAVAAVVAAGYFLSAGGLGGTIEAFIPWSIGMMLVGGAVVLFFNHRYAKWESQRG